MDESRAQIVQLDVELWCELPPSPKHLGQHRKSQVLRCACWLVHLPSIDREGLAGSSRGRHPRLARNEGFVLLLRHGAARPKPARRTESHGQQRGRHLHACVSVAVVRGLATALGRSLLLPHPTAQSEWHCPAQRCGVPGRRHEESTRRFEPHCRIERHAHRPIGGRKRTDQLWSKLE